MNKDVDAFKKELGNYSYYRGDLIDISEQIQIFEYKRSNIHGIDPSKEHSLSGTAWVESEEFRRISDELDKLNARKELRIRQISYIESVLDQMTEEARKACVLIYACKKTYSEVSRELMMSRNALFYRVQKELDEIL